ncbi:T9SS type A sorting domain-containing protein [Aestuariibaculum lutulentum]|nr:T9SS type A sorting domain-containing protein [Aestuariibaculum lutulentum]
MAAQNHSSIKANLSNQIKQSKQVVEGKVISQESFWDDAHQNIFTRQIIEVNKVFKGELLKTVEVITNGGVVDLDAIIVSHSLQLKKGDFGMFILDEISDKNLTSKNRNKLFQSVGDLQGFYKYDVKGNVASNGGAIYDNISIKLYNDIIKQTQKNPEILKSNELEMNGEIQDQVIQSNLVTNTTLTMASFNGARFTAGTKSILTINGSGFGDVKGSVSFSDANLGGFFYAETLGSQIMSWTNTQIEVEIPDYAGTGYVKVNTIDNGTIKSTEKLVIDYAEVNLNYNGRAYQTQHVDKNNNGGYTWFMNEEFYNSDANAAFTRALNTWKCETGINWEVSSEITTLTKYNLYDNLNTITFTDNIGATTLGQCFSRYAGCVQDGAIKWYVVEMDIIFNRSVNWNYSTAEPISTQVDFESVTVHELGHGHQLGHVVNPDIIMHFSLESGETLRKLNAIDIEGAQDVQSRSTSGDVCGELSMVSASCAILSNEDVEVTSQFSIYPNPVKNTLFIKNNHHLLIKSITIYNIQGREVFKRLDNDNIFQKEVNVSHLTSGVYLLNILSDQGSIRKKLIIN